MKILGIHHSLVADLVEAPETGMGYQVLWVQLEQEVPRYVLVLNGEIAKEIRTETIPLKKAIETEAHERILKAMELAPERIQFRVLSRLEAATKGLFEHRTEKTGGGPASEAEPELSRVGERFLRDSAFLNDRRINPDRSVKPGTYVTTRADGMTYVKTGMDAVRRYALPNPEPAIYRFDLDPPIPILVRRGIVAPAHGQPGGGVEVLFDRGAPSGTYRPPAFTMEPGR